MQCNVIKMSKRVTRLNIAKKVMIFGRKWKTHKCLHWSFSLETVKRVGLIWPVNWRERAILPASSDWSSQIQMNQSELVLSPYAYIRHVSKQRLVALQVLTLNSNKVIVHLKSWFSAIIPLKVYICIRTNFACTEVFKGIFWSWNMIKNI